MGWGSAIDPAVGWGWVIDPVGLGWATVPAVGQGWVIAPAPWEQATDPGGWGWVTDPVGWGWATQFAGCGWMIAPGGWGSATDLLGWGSATGPVGWGLATGLAGWGWATDPGILDLVRESVVLETGPKVTAPAAESLRCAVKRMTDPVAVGTSRTVMVHPATTWAHHWVHRRHLRCRCHYCRCCLGQGRRCCCHHHRHCWRH